MTVTFVCQGCGAETTKELRKAPNRRRTFCSRQCGGRTIGKRNAGVATPRLLEAAQRRMRERRRHLVGALEPLSKWECFSMGDRTGYQRGYRAGLRAAERTQKGQAA